MTWTGYCMLGGVVICAAASFFFALAESALFALGQWRARQLAGQRDTGLVLRLLEHPAELLATLALGNTIANGCIVALAIWPALLGAWPLEWAIIVALGLILVGCEIVPKTLGVRAPEHWAQRVARPILLLQQLTGGLQRGLQAVHAWMLRTLLPKSFQPRTTTTDEEYRELLEMAFQQGALAQSEKEIILQIVSLDRKTVRDVMKPLSRVAAIPDDLSVEDMVAAARKYRHRRLPMYDETPDTIVSVLNTRTLLFDPEKNFEDAIEFPSFVPEGMNLLQLLQSLQRQHRELAIVMDEFGGTAGLVTLEDILEEVIGPMRREDKPAGFIMEKLGPSRWRVNGMMRLDDFRREYPELGEVPEVDTVGGLLVQLCEVVPGAGQTASFRGLRLTAHVVDERRVLEVMVERRGK